MDTGVPATRAYVQAFVALLVACVVVLVATVVVALISHGTPLERFGRSAETFGGSAVVSAALVVAMFLRFRRATTEEHAAGYTTFPDNDLGLEQRDPVTGAVVQESDPSPAIGRPRPGMTPITGGRGTQPVPLPGGRLRLFVDSGRDVLVFALGVVLDAAAWGGTSVMTVRGVAIDSDPLLGAAAVGTVLASLLLAVLLVFPAALVTHAKMRRLEAGPSGQRAWSVAPVGSFAVHLYRLPAPDTRVAQPGIGWSLVLLASTSELSFWRTRGAELECVLHIPFESVDSIDLSWTNYLVTPQSALNLNLVANDGSRVTMSMVPLLSGWRFGPAQSARIKREIDVLMR